MREDGIVIEIHGEFAKVEAKRSLACEGCVSKDTCKPDGNSSMVVEVLNPVNARVGDRVNFEISSGVLIKAAFLIYLIPVIFLSIGAWLGRELADMYFQQKNKETVSVISAIISFIMGTMLLIIVNRFYKDNKKYKPVIKEIIYTRG